MLLPRPAVLRRFVLLTAYMVFLCATAPRSALAQAGTSPPPNSWAGELEALVQYVNDQRREPECSAQCFTLERLRISGSSPSEPVQFELTGTLLTHGSFSVPLFGPPDQVQVEHVTDDHEHAVPIGFDNGHYYASVSSTHFVLRGTLTLRGDLSLTIPGPLNLLESDFTRGRVVEGAALSGLDGATIHFDAEEAAQRTAEPTVFQLSRALRVGRETAFEYRLTLRSGSDLGVVRLPLRYGERVLDVVGADGWRVEGDDLVLPTTSRAAQITVTGTLPHLGAFTPDSRAAYEWFLLESDAEHRITVSGDARQMDVSQSPVPARQSNARLYLVQRGQHIDASVETLASIDALAAVVRNHDRTVVITERGDVVTDDRLVYENGGFDYLAYDPRGRPIFTSSDGNAARLTRAPHDLVSVLLPLQRGTHEIRVQTLGELHFGWLGGVLDVPSPSYPIAASHASVTIGFPRFVHPVLVSGTDRAHWPLGLVDALAVIAAIATAWFALRSHMRRVLGSFILAGLWFLSHPVFVITIATVTVGAALFVASRVLTGRVRTVVVAGVSIGAMTLATCLAVHLAHTGDGYASLANAQIEALGAARRSERYAIQADQVRVRGVFAALGGSEGGRGSADAAPADSIGYGGLGAPSENGNTIVGESAVLEGVTPVPLGLPDFEQSVTASRELVTRARPFTPRVYYLTNTALFALSIAWLLSIVLLGCSYRRELERLRARIAHRVALAGATAHVGSDMPGV